MTETFYSMCGIRRFTRLAPRWNLRLAVLALAVVVVVLLILWIQRSVGSQLVKLEQEFGALKAESFYVGVRMRVSFRRLNEHLLDWHLNHAEGDRDEFLAAADDLNRWLRNQEALLSSDNERQLLQQMQVAYQRFLQDAAQGVAPIEDPATFRSVYQTLRQQSQELLGLIEQFVEAQQAAFNVFLQVSQESMLSVRRLLTLSLVLLVTATVALAVMAYRGMIAPLRREVSQNRAIIERQEKLASLGTLAAGLAHEIRNPLTAIKFRLFSLAKSLPPELHGSEDLQVIGGEINRLDRIVKDFLEFARPSEPIAVLVPAGRVLQEVHGLLSPQLEKLAIGLRLESPPEPLWIRADAQQIKQVLINLVQNAADSIARDGSITLRAAPGTVPLGGRSRPAVLFAVADTGKGIPPEVEQRLFDPFFSTKENGTGLGLAIAARIVEKHGGLLRYETQLNHGTTFEVVLPCLDDHAPATPHH